VADMYLRWSRHGLTHFVCEECTGDREREERMWHLFMARRNSQLLANLFRSQAGHTSLWMEDVPYLFLRREDDNIYTLKDKRGGNSCE
jgi:hypothetical protein